MRDEQAGAAIGAHVFSQVTNHWCPDRFCTKGSPEHLVNKVSRRQSVAWSVSRSASQWGSQPTQAQDEMAPPLGLA